MAKKARFSEVVVDRLVVRDPSAPSNKTFVIEGGHKEKGEGTAKLHIHTPDGETYVSQGIAGEQGEQGTAGATGASAYEMWLAAGNDGDESVFMLSLVGGTGQTGDTGPAGGDGKTLSVNLTRESVVREDDGDLVGDTSDILLQSSQENYDSPEYKIEKTYTDSQGGTHGETISNWGNTSTHTISSNHFPLSDMVHTYIVRIRESSDGSNEQHQSKSLACVRNGAQGIQGIPGISITGPVGPQGPIGPPGESITGDTGPMGPAAIDGIQLGAYLDRETVQRDAAGNLIGDTSNIKLHFLSNGYENPEYRVMEEEPAEVYTTLADWGVATTPYTITNSDFPATADNKVYVVSVRDSVTTGYMLTQKKTLSCIQNGKDGIDAPATTLTADVSAIRFDEDGDLHDGQYNVHDGTEITADTELIYRAESSGYTNPEYRFSIYGGGMGSAGWIVLGNDPHLGTYGVEGLHDDLDSAGWGSHDYNGIVYTDTTKTPPSETYTVGNFEDAAANILMRVETREQGESNSSSRDRAETMIVADGKKGDDGEAGTPGIDGEPGAPGANGDDGADGYSFSVTATRYVVIWNPWATVALDDSDIVLSFHEAGFTNPYFYIYKNNVEFQGWTTSTSKSITLSDFPAADTQDTYKVLVREGSSGVSDLSTSFSLQGIRTAADGADGTSVIANNFDMTHGRVGWSKTATGNDGATAPTYEENTEGTFGVMLSPATAFGRYLGRFQADNKRKFYCSQAIPTNPEGDYGGTFLIKWRGSSVKTAHFVLFIRCYDKDNNALGYMYWKVKDGFPALSSTNRETTFVLSEDFEKFETGKEAMYTAFIAQTGYNNASPGFKASDLIEGTRSFKIGFYRDYAGTDWPTGTVYVDYYGVRYVPANGTSDNLGYPDNGIDEDFDLVVEPGNY